MKTTNLWISVGLWWTAAAMLEASETPAEPFPALPSISQVLHRARQGVASAADQAAEDEELVGRLSGADAVVIGRVNAIRAVPRLPSAPYSEHDPNWQEAVITIRTVLKGRETLQQVTVRFPGSQDIAWRSAPRFETDQEGIWILRRRNAPYHDWYENPNPDYHTALRSTDFHTTNQLSRIQRLLDEAETRD